MEASGNVNYSMDHSSQLQMSEATSVFLHELLITPISVPFLFSLSSQFISVHLWISVFHTRMELCVKICMV